MPSPSAPLPRHIALTGVPRSGTTLCCRLLGQAEDAVALFEPMDVGKLPADDRSAALDTIDHFFHESRQSLRLHARARSHQVGGTVPDNPIASHRRSDGARVRESSLGEIAVDKPLSDTFTLVVKHNAAFTALLPELAGRFETWAVVRNPLAVLASWHSVSLPVSQGGLPAGERLDTALAGTLAGLPDRIDRQLAILDWFFSRFHGQLPPARTLRYEDIVASGGRVLADACAVAVPAASLAPRNASPLYDAALGAELAKRLVARPGAWRRFYDPAEVTALAARFAAASD